MAAGSAAAPLVVLTRDPAGNRRWTDSLNRAGFRVHEAPMLEIAPLPLTPELATVIGRLPSFNWLIFTSARAVPALQSLIRAADVSSPHMPPVAVVGPATATAARAAGWHVHFQPNPSTSAALGAQLTPVDNRRILLARSNIAATNLAATLRQRGAIVTDLPVYATILCTTPDPQLAHRLGQSSPIVLILASPSAVHALSANHPTALHRPTVAIGPTTAAAARAAGFTVVHEAAGPAIATVIDRLREIA